MLTPSCNHSRQPQYVVVHVLRDPAASFAAELRRADLAFSKTKPHIANGKLLIVATNEDGYAPILQRFSDSPLELVIFDSEANIPGGIRQQLGPKEQVCGHHPAFVPTVFTGEQREAAQDYLRFLASNCK